MFWTLICLNKWLVEWMINWIYIKIKRKRAKWKVKILEMGEQRKNFSEKVSYLTNLGPLGGGDTPFNPLQPGFWIHPCFPCWSWENLLLQSGTGVSMHVALDPAQLIAHSGCHIKSTLKKWTIEATSLKISIGLKLFNF